MQILHRTRKKKARINIYLFETYFDIYLFRLENAALCSDFFLFKFIPIQSGQIERIKFVSSIFFYRDSNNYLTNCSYLSNFNIPPH